MAPEKALTTTARVGFAARGLVYILVGWFAIDAAQSGARPTDNEAALATLADKPLGGVLLMVIAVGLAGYAVWRLLEAALDPEQKGHDTQGAFARAGYALSGIVHLVLAFTAAKLATRERPEGGAAPGDANAREWSVWLMEQPAGVLLVALVGLVLFLVAFTQARAAYTAKFARHMDGDTPAPKYVTIVGRIGFAARAIVFTIIGWFFVSAALNTNPQEAGGMGQALRELQRQDYGPAMLWVVAAGLMLFGVFSLIEARYRRIKVTPPPDTSSSAIAR